MFPYYLHVAVSLVFLQYQFYVAVLPFCFSITFMLQYCLNVELSLVSCSNTFMLQYHFMLQYYLYVAVLLYVALLPIHCRITYVTYDAVSPVYCSVAVFPICCIITCMLQCHLQELSKQLSLLTVATIQNIHLGRIQSPYIPVQVHGCVWTTKKFPPKYFTLYSSSNLSKPTQDVHYMTYKDFLFS